MLSCAPCCGFCLRYGRREQTGFWRERITCASPCSTAFCAVACQLSSLRSPGTRSSDRLSQTNWSEEIVADFFRAALLEECFKLTGFLLAWRKYRPERKIDCILIAGTIGLTYAVVEKAAMANPVSAIIGSIVPMHILWQFNQGGHFYEYLQAKARNDQACAWKEWFMAFIVPFLLHGCWDSALSAIIYCAGREDSTAMQVVSAATLIAVLALGLTYTIKTIRKVRRIAKEAPEAPNRAPAIQ